MRDTLASQNVTLDAPTEAVTERKETPWILRHTMQLLAAVFLAALVFVAITAPYIAPSNPLVGDILANLLPPGGEGMGGTHHTLGTDMLGRDVFSGILYGSRISLLVGVASVAGAGLIGTALGVIAGYFRGWTDEILMRIVDVQLAFPFILLAILIMYVLGQGLLNVIIVLVIATWPIYARVARAETLKLRESEYVLAARAIGASRARIIIRHILPNAMTPLIVIATFSVPQMIIFEAALSFLGVGIPPSEISWGSMLAAGRDYLGQAWWIATLPGVAIMCTILSINILGDWLRNWLDPNLRNQ
jgi:peptide/nickel transport system permease protein